MQSLENICEFRPWFFPMILTKTLAHKYLFKKKLHYPEECMTLYKLHSFSSGLLTGDELPPSFQQTFCLLESRSTKTLIGGTFSPPSPFLEISA
jgi:hypothetical protein